MINIAIIGYGYWGPNILRNVSRHPGLNVTWVCDINSAVTRDIGKMYPTVGITDNFRNVLQSSDVDAVIIATPPSTHFPLSRDALTAGKHVLVEKPMTQVLSESVRLVDLAKKKKKILMVDHTFIFTPAIQMIQAIVASGSLGEVYAVDSVRTNLGILQKDSNVIADLAVHDFSIMDFLFHKKPVSISATGLSNRQIHQETVAYISVKYGNSLFLHSHVSWLSPVKIRRMILTGTKKMLTFDDIEPTEKIKIYDKGVSVIKDPKEFHQMRIGYRNGDIVIPNIPLEEGLWGMISEFETAIRTGNAPVTDGRQGKRIVQYVEAATQSIRAGGKGIIIRS